jgi:PAS domain S-box-containing protein
MTTSRSPASAPGASPLTPWLLAGFGAVLAVLVVALVAGPVNLRKVYGATEAVAHTQAVRAALQELLTTTIDAETGQRGFIITADDSYLEPYARSQRTIEADVVRVRSLTADNTAQQEDLEHVVAAVTRRLELIEQSIRLRRDSGFTAAQAIVTTGEGKILMDDMRMTVARMEAREEALLEIRNAEARRSYRVAQALGLVTTALGLLVLGLLFSGTRQFGADRRRAEQAADRMNITLRSIGDAVVTTDNQGRILGMNPVAQALMGWTEAEAVGKPLEDTLVIINEHTRRAAEHPIGRVLREGTVVGLANHTILISKDGREIPIDDSAAPIKSAEGELLGVIMVFRDITERHQAERDRAQLIERERLARRHAEQANRTKDEFLAMVSHELRTPLNAILGWADMLRSGTLAGERRDRAIDAVYSNAMRQTRLIDELLDLSRIISGKMQMERSALDFPALLRSAVDVIQPAADGKHIRLTVDAAEAPQAFYGDPARLQQVLVNLLSNAIKFTPDGGIVGISLQGTGNGVTLTVTDSGQGIPQEFLPSIFEPFRQIDQLTTRRHGGLGLGLSIVRQLVEAHGGTVRAESEGQDKGSRFIVQLPLVPVGPAGAGNTAAGTQSVPASANGAGLHGVVVLTVDDDADSRDLLVATLEQHGAVVLTASSTREALEILGKTPVQVLLSDVAMSGEDGYTLIRRVRAMDSSGIAHIPAAALTSLAREEDRRDAIRAGFHLHLTKPIEVATLVEAVASLARRRQPSAAAHPASI